MASSDKLTHLDEAGAVHMVDVGSKAVSLREARAEAYIRMQPETLDAALSGNTKKGAVLATAELAGIMAAKRTSELIPLCHALALTKVAVDISPDHSLPGLRIATLARCTGQTGVEMEALTAASVAALTLYDMLKALDRGMEIGGVRLLAKSGGQSGDWVAP